MIGLSAYDLAALAVFISTWLAYHFYHDHGSGAARSLNRVMDEHRIAWMEQMATREVRIVDTQVTASLQNGAAFFASTSLIAIGGALSALGATDRVLAVFSAFPLAMEMTREGFELRVMGLAGIFVYAFFKMAWAYRLFNYSAILIGATPELGRADEATVRRAARRAGRMNVSAGRHFNRGLRAFFFALAYLGWFAGPLALVASTAAVLVVLMRRQYVSDSLAAVHDGETP